MINYEKSDKPVENCKQFYPDVCLDARICSLSRVSFGLELVGIGSEARFQQAATVPARAVDGGVAVLAWRHRARAADAARAPVAEVKLEVEGVAVGSPGPFREIGRPSHVFSSAVGPPPAWSRQLLPGRVLRQPDRQSRIF